MNFGSDEPIDSLDKLVYRNFLKPPPNLHLQCHLRIEHGSWETNWPVIGRWAKRRGSTLGRGNRPEGCCDWMNQLCSENVKTRIWTQSKKRLGVKRTCYRHRAAGVTLVREQVSANLTQATVSNVPRKTIPGDNLDPAEDTPRGLAGSCLLLNFSVLVFTSRCISSPPDRRF